MKTKLNYYAHMLLNSKHRLLLNMLVYIIIMFTYNIYFNEIPFIECMKESNIEYTLPQESNSDYVKYLEQEAWKMDKRIEGLENELKIYKEEDKVVNRIIEIERDLEQIRTDIRTLNENNESNSPTYIIFCNII